MQQTNFIKKGLQNSKYIEKIYDFIDKNKQKSKNNKSFKTPLWYNFIFINQNLRLRFKRIIIKKFLFNFT